MHIHAKCARSASDPKSIHRSLSANCARTISVPTTSRTLKAYAKLQCERLRLWTELPWSAAVPIKKGGVFPCLVITKYANVWSVYVKQIYKQSFCLIMRVMRQFSVSSPAFWPTSRQTSRLHRAFYPCFRSLNFSFYFLVLLFQNRKLWLIKSKQTPPSFLSGCCGVIIIKLQAPFS